jgi:hypothetical protein
MIEGENTKIELLNSIKNSRIRLNSDQIVVIIHPYNHNNVYSRSKNMIITLYYRRF